MRCFLRRVLRLGIMIGVLGAAAAGIRALVARMSGDPGIASSAGGSSAASSFDTWPPVPPAPAREDISSRPGEAR